MKKVIIILLSTFNIGFSFAATMDISFDLSLSSIEKRSGGDIIGNGGGVWSCGEIAYAKEIFLVDLYEAETEWQWSLKTFTGKNYQAILSEIVNSLNLEFPEYASNWSTRIFEVMSKMNYVNADLEIIEDALYRSKPKANLCLEGEWQYVQFANYTKFDSILVQKDIWESNQVSPIEKAGLVLHEAIYEWFREEFNDRDSTRARYLTGLIFAQLDVELKNEKLSKLLGVTPTPEGKGWVCAFAGNLTGRFYLGYGEDKTISNTMAENNCLEQDEFPRHCSRVPIPCERITNQEAHWSCSIKNKLANKIFIKKGRTRLEGMALVQNACVDFDQSLAVHCEAPTCTYN